MSKKKIALYTIGALGLIALVLVLAYVGIDANITTTINP
jgi:hypothetical protein